jgi:hypothetical protein
MTPPKKILVLILASDDQPLYKEFQKRWLKYMDRHPLFDCYFYKANPDQKEHMYLSDRTTLSIKMTESLGNVYEKTLMAFRFFRPHFDRYEFIFRTNLSSFLVFDTYLEYCKKCPKSNFCSAYTMPFYLRHDPSFQLRFPSGAGITFSPDVIELLLSDPPKKFSQDDVTIGIFLKEKKIQIVEAPHLTPKSIAEADIDNIPDSHPHIYHFRLKTDADRTTDLTLYDRLLTIYYGRN